jgi:hypothetical protein
MKNFHIQPPHVQRPLFLLLREVEKFQTAAEGEKMTNFIAVYIPRIKSSVAVRFGLRLINWCPVESSRLIN